MQKTSTLKPFAKGDIFLGCTYLNDPSDDHKGEGRILQFDRNWIAKGTWYTTGTRYFIVGCTVVSVSGQRAQLHCQPRSCVRG